MPRERATVAITDAGGRGAALAEAYANSPHVGRILMIPGNSWVEHQLPKKYGKQFDVFPGIKINDRSAIAALCLEEGVLLADVCQDNAVAAGVADELRANKILTVGPSAAAGRIESDKIYARRLGDKLGLPQPWARAFNNPQDGIAHLDGLKNIDVFVKAAGLAEGKGALKAGSFDEAVDAVLSMKNFGEAGVNYLIEDCLRSDNGEVGEEFSAFYLCNGAKYNRLGTAQDYKRAYDGDKGPNTGSMGSSSNVTVEHGVLNNADEHVAKVLRQLEADENPYNGVLYYSGMVLNKRGIFIPHNVEFNSRWGDPEVEAILPGIKNDWFEVSMEAALGCSGDLKIENDGLSRVVVTLASKGYPGSYKEVTGMPITGIEDAQKMDNVRIYGAGVKVDKAGNANASGGRLLYAVGEGENILDAQKAAYAAIDVIKVGENGEYGHYRNDIGWREAQKHKSQ